VIISPIFQATDTHVPFSIQQDILDYATKVICLAEGERERIRRHLYVREEKTVIIPNGIAQAYRGNGVEPFQLPNGEEYVLCVGRINEKNQLQLARVCKELDLSLVLIGEVHTPGFLDHLAEIAHPKCFYYGPKTGTELIPFYKGAKVVACVSFAEVFPMVVMEGGLGGCNIVLTTGSEAMKDWPNVELCVPSDVDSIKQAITRQFARPKNMRLAEMLAGYTWDRIARQVKELYEECISSSVSPIWSNALSLSSWTEFTHFPAVQFRAALTFAFVWPAWVDCKDGQIPRGLTAMAGALDLASARGIDFGELCTHVLLYRVTGLDDRSRLQLVRTTLSHPCASPTLAALKSRIEGYFHAVKAFEYYAAGDQTLTRNHATRAVINDPMWLRNRGMISILLQSLAGSRPWKCAQRLKRRAQMLVEMVNRDGTS